MNPNFDDLMHTTIRKYTDAMYETFRGESDRRMAEFLESIPETDWGWVEFRVQPWPTDPKPMVVKRGGVVAWFEARKQRKRLQEWMNNRDAWDNQLANP